MLGYSFNQTTLLCVSPAIDHGSDSVTVTVRMGSEDISIPLEIRIVDPPVVVHIEPLTAVMGNSATFTVMLGDPISLPQSQMECFLCGVSGSITSTSPSASYTNMTNIFKCATHGISGRNLGSSSCDFSLYVYGTVFFVTTVQGGSPIEILTMTPLVGFADVQTGNIIPHLINTSLLFTIYYLLFNF